MSTITENLSDPELAATEWDLAPLLDGEEDRATVERMLDEAKERATRFSETYSGQVAELDAEGVRARGHARARGDQRADWPGGLLRQPALLDRHGGTRARRAAPARAGARHRDRDPAPVLRARLGRARRRPRGAALVLGGPRPLPPPPRERAALPPPPALRV